MNYRSATMFVVVALLVVGGMTFLPGCETTQPGSVSVNDVPPPAEPPPKPPAPVKPPRIEEVTKVAVPVDLAKYYNVNAFEGSTAQEGGFDGWGNAYRPNKMPTDKMLTDVNTKVAFSVADPTKERLNSITANGESIKVPFGKYSTAYIVASATDGNFDGEVTLQYATGRATAPLRISDWCAPAAFDETAYATFDSRMVPDAATEEEAQKECYIWIQKVDLDKERTLTAVVLPANEQLHVFAISVAP